FRDLFAFRFEISDSDSTADALAKFRAGMADGDIAPADADRIGHWAGFDFSSSPSVQVLLGQQELGGVARAQLVRYLRTVMTRAPAVVILEDLHWADDASLELLDALAAELGNTRVMFVATTRPPVLPRVASLPVTHNIDLAALGTDDVAHMIDDVLQRVEAVP